MNYIIRIRKDSMGKVTMWVVTSDGRFIVNGIRLPDDGAEGLPHGHMVQAILCTSENPDKVES